VQPLGRRLSEAYRAADKRTDDWDESYGRLRRLFDDRPSQLRFLIVERREHPVHRLLRHLQEELVGVAGILVKDPLAFWRPKPTLIGRPREGCVL
jgi:hypothetical protein